MAERRAIKPAEMYGITRCKKKEYGKCLSWKVSMSRRRMRLYKTFFDQTWGGSENALAAAKRYRDTMVQLVPPLTMLEHVQRIKANNTSGVVGVGSRQTRWGVVWVASIGLPGGKKIAKVFSESVHGSRAREMAIQARQDMLGLMDETHTLIRSPGAIAEANPTEFAAALPRVPRTIIVRVSHPGINGGVAHKYISVIVSGAISSRVQKTFSTNAHGQAGALRLAMQTALEAVIQFGGEEAAQIFMRDYVEKYKRLPKKGISARIRFMPVEDATNHDISEA